MVRSVVGARRLCQSHAARPILPPKTVPRKSFRVPQQNCQVTLARVLLVSNATPRVEQKMIMGSCDRAAELSKTQNGGFKPRADVVSDLAGLFGERISGWKMTETADALHARSCHNMTLPCSDKVRRPSAFLFCVVLIFERAFKLHRGLYQKNVSCSPYW